MQDNTYIIYMINKIYKSITIQYNTNYKTKESFECAGYITERDALSFHHSYQGIK